jgi:anti-sigma B factor antagonist
MPVSGSFSQGLHIETTEGDGAIRLVLYGELDLSNAPTLDAELRRAEEAAGAYVEVDLSHLRFIDPTGVAVFLRAGMRNLEGARRLRMLPGPAHVQRTFRLCGTEDVLFDLRPRDDGDSDSDSDSVA